VTTLVAPERLGTYPRAHGAVAPELRPAHQTCVVLAEKNPTTTAGYPAALRLGPWGTGPIFARLSDPGFTLEGGRAAYFFGVSFEYIFDKVC